MAWNKLDDHVHKIQLRRLLRLKTKSEGRLEQYSCLVLTFFGFYEKGAYVRNEALGLIPLSMPRAKSDKEREGKERGKRGTTTAATT